jgi:hypothetical protein
MAHVSRWQWPLTDAKPTTAEGARARGVAGGGGGTLMGVAIAQVMDHVAPGLCENERPSSLAIDEAQLPAGSTLMVEDSHRKMPSFKPYFTCIVPALIWRT